MYPLKVTYKNCLRRYGCARIIGSYELYMLIPKKKTFQGLIAINLILFLTGIVFIIKING